MAKKKDLSIFLKGQLEQVKEQIKSRNYDSDIDEQMILWDLYQIIFINLGRLYMDTNGCP